MARQLGAEEFVALPERSYADVLAELLTASNLPVDRNVSRHAVASVLVVTDDGHVLLARNRTGGWGTVGGHLEPHDESLRAAAARELAEEVGLVVEEPLLEPLVFLADREEFRPGHAHADFVFVLRVGGTVPVVAADDVSEAGWFALDDLPPLNDHMTEAVAALRQA